MTADGVLRQKLLVLCTGTPDLTGAVCAWAIWDGTGKEDHTTGDADEPPYPSVLAAMRDGWRCIQFPPPTPTPPQRGAFDTGYLRFEFVLESIERV
jgi:hypothetical protein